MKGIYIPVAVCGERYVDRWLRYALPTLLAPGNLPALAQSYRIKLLLCSTHKDLQRLLASPLMTAARDIMGVRTIPLAQSMAELAPKIQFNVQKFNLMNVCHNYGVELAWQDDYGLVCGLGDAIYTDGSFKEVARHISAGKRAVISQGLDIRQEPLDVLLEQNGVKRNEFSLPIPPRTFARIAAQALHPVAQSMIWTSERFTHHPSVLYWPLGGHGVLVRGFHLYPVFLYPDRKAQIRTTIDGDFLVDALSSLDDCVFLNDSDSFFFAGVSDQSKMDFIPAQHRRADTGAISEWMLTNTRAFQREIFIHEKFWLHDGIDHKAWRHVEEDSDAAVAKIMQAYRDRAGSSAAA